jgi:hypothetical protein
MSSDFNQDHFFNKKEKAYFLLCGLIIASCVVWITQVPEWKWKKVFSDGG